MTQVSPWLLRVPRPDAAFRLFCFCYAGGNAASYLPWQGKVDSAIEICALQPPGRGARLFEPPLGTMDVMVSAVSAVVDRMDDLPFAFFGHSLGALVAFELAHYRAQRGLRVPVHLLLSGCLAPGSRSEPKNLHLLDDARLVDELRKYNGTPPEILAHQELMALVLPTIRADFRLASEYRHVPRRRLDMPISVLAGRADDYDSTEQYENWLTETDARGSVHWFDGDHFFINSELDRTLGVIQAELTPYLQPLQAHSARA